MGPPSKSFYNDRDGGPRDGKSPRVDDDAAEDPGAQEDELHLAREHLRNGDGRAPHVALGARGERGGSRGDGAERRASFRVGDGLQRKGRDAALCEDDARAAHGTGEVGLAVDDVHRHGATGDEEERDLEILSRRQGEANLRVRYVGAPLRAEGVRPGEEPRQLHLAVLAGLALPRGPERGARDLHVGVGHRQPSAVEHGDDDRAQAMERDQDRTAIVHAAIDDLVVTRGAHAEDPGGLGQAPDVRATSAVCASADGQRLARGDLDLCAGHRFAAGAAHLHVEEVLRHERQDDLSLARHEHQAPRRARLARGVGEDPGLAARQPREVHRPVVRSRAGRCKIHAIVQGDEDAHLGRAYGRALFVHGAHEQGRVALAAIVREPRGRELVAHRPQPGPGQRRHGAERQGHEKEDAHANPHGKGTRGAA